ncbi:hypothetical protein [Fluoribacter gormanii]|uniref:Interaptin n=1 Tax=Fluoribacter gormanii TaxID=464 RepID=A0A377GG68_9GAMM|nr:hypothetical protein [Fluoribacter gormanii]KTD02812.1 interaptin [Fluoribacter gormanii]SIR57851.1 hypothetical protein SAMN05421777_1162 [Fluoribacter gormanii]STO23830.1 Uncharacterised protein [Fluoribacter gormanii]
MPKNNSLLAAINNPALLSKGDLARHALDELISVDLSDPVNLRKAVTKHRVLWGREFGIRPDGIDTWESTNPRFLAGADADDYLNDETFLDSTDRVDSFAKIKQAATEQRIHFGLSAVTDQEVLINILKYNSDECRAYLTKKVVPEMPEPQGWHATAPHATPGHPGTNDSRDILTDEAVIRIQQQAAKQLLFQLIAKPDLQNPKLLDDLISARNDLAQFKVAAQALGFPAEGLTSLEQEFPDELFDKAQERSDALKKVAALEEFNRILSTLDYTWLSSKTPMLGIASPEGFLNTLLNQPEFLAVKDTLKEDKAVLGAKVQQQLCARYLQDKLLKDGLNLGERTTKGAPICNANNEADLKAALKNGIPGHDAIIDKAVGTDNLNLFKVSMIKGLLSKIPSNAHNIGYLKGLDQAKIKDLPKRLAGFIDNGNDSLSLDFLKPEHLNDIKGVIREQLKSFARDQRIEDFKDLVDKAQSSYGREAHKALIDLFRQLPEEKQVEILSVEKRNDLNLVINARTLEQIKFFWGTVNSHGQPLNVSALVLENERNAAFKNVHNPVIAKLLVNLDIPTDKIAAVNQALFDHRALNFSDPDHYKTLVEALWVASGSPANKNEFYQAFNLTAADSNVLVDPHEVANKIQAHHKNNVIVYERLQEPRILPAGKRFDELFLKVGRPGSWASADDVKKAEALFVASKDVHEFLDKLIPEPNDEQSKALKESLSRALTPTVFREIKAEKRKNLFDKDNDENKQKIINEVTQELTELQKSKPSIEEHKAKLEKIPDNKILQASLYNLALEGNTSERTQAMKKTYKELSEQCDEIIEHLETNLRDLDACLESTKEPQPPNDIKSLEVRRQFTEMREKLEAEKSAVSEQLAFYKTTKAKISGEKGLLSTIDEFSSGKVRLQHKSSNVMYKAIEKDQVATLARQLNPAATTSLGTTLSTNRDPNYSIEEIPEKGKVLCADMVHYQPDENNPGNKIEADKGRFTVDFHPEGKIVPGLLQGSEVYKRHPQEVKIFYLSEDPNYKAKDAIEAAMNLLERWDGKTPITLKGVKGKEEELQYLWTALVVLGEHHPNFSQSKIEFSVRNTAAWNPSVEKNWRGFTKESVYESVFKGTAKSHIAEQVADFKSIMDKRKREELDTTSKKTVSDYKENLSGIKTPNDKNKKIEGPVLSQGSNSIKK